MRAWGFAVLALASGSCPAGEASPFEVLARAAEHVAQRQARLEVRLPPSYREPEYCVDAFLLTAPPIVLRLPGRSGPECIYRDHESGVARPYRVEPRQ